MQIYIQCIILHLCMFTFQYAYTLLGSHSQILLSSADFACMQILHPMSKSVHVHDALVYVIIDIMSATKCKK
jgi:hypothetical protein